MEYSNLYLAEELEPFRSAICTQIELLRNAFPKREPGLLVTAAISSVREEIEKAIRMQRQEEGAVLADLLEQQNTMPG